MGATDTRILVVDDDADLRAALTEFISKLGVKVRTAGSAAEAQHLLQTDVIPFDLVITDLKIPGGTGMDVLRAAHARNPETAVSIITGYASMETAIEAIRLGAYDYITKPFSLNEIGVLVRNMIERVNLSKENARLSLRLQELYQQVNRAQSERADVARWQEELVRHMQENSRKLDLVLNMLSGKTLGRQVSTAHPDRMAIATLIQAVERLDRSSESAGVSRIELEEKKRDLIEEFVSQY